MSIRWRKSGELLCAAMTETKEGDCYIDDRLHYELSVVQKCILGDAEHEKNGLWHWVHPADDNPNSYMIRAVKENDCLEKNK